MAAFLASGGAFFAEGGANLLREMGDGAFLFAAAAAFLMFRRAAADCLAVGIGS